jgi:hypothetical protein
MQSRFGILVYKYKYKVTLLVTVSILLIQINYLINNNNLEAMGSFFSEQKQPMLTYQNNDFNFKIDYPSNWERSVKINNEIIFISPKDKDSVSSPAGSVIKVVPLQSKNVSVGSIYNALLSQLKKDYKDFKLESSGMVTIDGKNAKQLVFTATDSKFQNRKALQIITMDKGNIFILTYKALYDKFSDYEKTINEMISSFKFLSK